MTDLIFLGNGLLADSAHAALAQHFNIIFHARRAEDLVKVKELKQAHPSLPAVLASFGVIIKKDLLSLFEPTGIINLHPSLLPQYRGASPIESAILHSDTTLGLSVMKLAPQMDAGPLYHQTSFDFSELLSPARLSSAATIKAEIYHTLATAGASWLVENLAHLPTPTAQDEKSATFCAKIEKSASLLLPDASNLAPGQLQTHAKTAAELHREIIAYALYPRSKVLLGGHETLILASHIAQPGETPILSIKAKDGQILSLDSVQPAGKKPMDAKSFKNGYLK